ncbi:hypothetical protein Taro_039345 [Colocasia esculenta]|uniref:Uncharacterized protein n=1 Tax=Colocasia esculenta TaxID=4460 RepID=A0A843WLX7_COLES|nr:hypothetical protein [Colocasia esculenta]
MNPGDLFLVLAAFALAGTVAAIGDDARRPAPPPSNITVIGTVFCDICSNNTFTKHSYFLRGARVRVECSFKSNSTAKEEITISVERTTDRFGVYRVDVPPVDGFDCREGREIESFCRANLVRSSSALCDVPGLSISTEHVAVRCTKTNLCVYNLNALNYRPPKRDLALCGAAPAALTGQSLSKSIVDSALFFWPPFPPFGFHWPFPHWPPFPFPFPFPSPSSSFPFPFPFPSPPPSFPFPFPSPPPSFPFPFPFPTPPPSLPFPFPSPPPSFPIPFVPSPPPPKFPFPLPPPLFTPSPPPPAFPFPFPPRLFTPSPPPPAVFPFPFPPFPPLSPAPFPFTPSPSPPSPPPPSFPFPLPPFPPNPFAPAPPSPAPPPPPHFSLRDPSTWFPPHPPSPHNEPRTQRQRP